MTKNLSPSNPQLLDYSKHPAARLRLRLALEAQIKRSEEEQKQEKAA